MQETIRVHRVGSITAGISLVVFGVLFLLKMFTGLITYELVLSLWPLVLIGLGAEILISNIRADELKYDKGAVAVVLIMLVFATCMALTGEVMTHLNISATL